MNTVGINLNTKTLASSQYAGLGFTDACVFNGSLLLAGDSGIFTHDGTSDNGTAISAYFQIPSGSADTSKQKHFRKVIAGGYFSGKLNVTVVTDEDAETTFAVGAYDADNHTFEIPLNVEETGEFVTIKFANVSGSDFSFDFIQAVVMATVVSPKTTLRIGRGKFTAPAATVSASGS